MKSMHDLNNTDYADGFANGYNAGIRDAEWDMFNLISSAYYGKQMYSEPSNGITYSRYSCKNLTMDDAINEFIDIINSDLEGGYG